MRLTIGDRLRRKSDGVIFTLTHLGSWAGKYPRRVPLFAGLPVKLEGENGEKAEYAHVNEVYPLYGKR